MKILVSYFYQIRFFPSHVIPLSTAKWDPQWFHQNRGAKHVWIDKRGVVNGLRYEPFNPRDNNDENDPLCRGPETCKELNQQSCRFLDMYDKQLSEIDINKWEEDMNTIVQNLKKIGMKFQKEPIMCFIVHEAPNNRCSERRSIFKWAEINNIDCKEFDKNDFKED